MTPNLGRFITEDPARDGENWYAYTSRPLTRTDTTGLGVLDDYEYQKRTNAKNDVAVENTDCGDNDSGKPESKLSVEPKEEKKRANNVVKPDQDLRMTNWKAEFQEFTVGAFFLEAGLGIGTIDARFTNLDTFESYDVYLPVSISNQENYGLSTRLVIECGQLNARLPSSLSSEDIFKNFKGTSDVTSISTGTFFRTKTSSQVWNGEGLKFSVGTSSPSIQKLASEIPQGSAQLKSNNTPDQTMKPYGDAYETNVLIDPVKANEYINDFKQILRSKDSARLE